MTITAVALVISEYLIVRHFVVEFMAEQEPGFTGLALFIPVDVMFELVVEGVKADLLTLVFWAIALLAAFFTPARRRLRRVEKA